MLLSNSSLKNMKVISFFIFVILINASNQLTKSSKYWPTKSFDVKNLWNGEDYDEPPVSYHLTKKYINGLNIEISAPFYGDPAPPFNINKGHALYGLWNYEVVEIFFLASNNAEMYIELEFGPYGHHLGLLLHGRRNCLIHSFPITYNAKIDKENNIWRGEAFIPNEYFPPNIDKFNAYAIHGQPESQRIYKSLFPSNATQPDFHALEFFQTFDMKIDQDTLSDFWMEALGKNCTEY